VIASDKKRGHFDKVALSLNDDLHKAAHQITAKGTIIDTW
jgi:hypothetical protein